MRLTPLTSLFKIVIEYCFYIQRTMASRHGKYTWFLFNNNQITILVHKLYVMVLKLIILLCFTNGNLHARNQRIIKLCNNLPIDLNALS